VDQELAADFQAKRDRLPPTRIGSDGRIMEWLQEYPEQDPHHRHLSHLWGLYPGNEISPTATPDLAAAAEKSLNVRGDLSTGWATAFRMLMWARLHDGDRTLKLLEALLRPSNSKKTDYIGAGGGTYPNLFDAHPPFQIDGNFGGTAGIAEMFLQSQAGEIQLLPALPSAWPAGKITGLRARGGYEVSVEWKDGKLTSATVKNICGQGTMPVRYGDKVVQLTLKQGKTKTFNGELE
jgi:alpha-L-fucosidase 2